MTQFAFKAADALCLFCFHSRFCGRIYTMLDRAFYCPAKNTHNSIHGSPNRIIVLDENNNNPQKSTD